MTVAFTAYAVIIGVSAAVIPLMVWVVRNAKSSGAKRRAGSYAVMYALFFSIGKMFEGGPDYVEVAKEPERKKRTESGDSPET